MHGKSKIAGIIAAFVLVIGLPTYVFTAPYPGNTGWQRTPGVRIGGTESPAPADFTPLNEVGVNLKMKLVGFPPFVVYLSYVGTPDGVITATRPDGGYWAQRVRDRGGDGWLRIGDRTFAMRATEVLGDERIPMLEAYSARTGLPMDRPVGGPDPVRDWEVFLWTPR
ncbi:MAG TPA: hypothetical protein VLA09_10130 [Longimicrobiales bacterium]|nr:hypothetical protein [Longimicrobiales bacterium]